MRQDVLPGLAARADEEAVTGLVQDLGQREVEPGVRRLAPAHRDAQARDTRFGALGGDQEGSRPPFLVAPVPVPAADQDPVLDRDRPQNAGAYAQEGVRRLPEVLLGDRQAAVRCPLGAPELLALWVQQRLPRLWAGRVGGLGTVGTRHEAFAAGLDLRAPSEGQVVGQRCLVEDDGTVPDRGADDRVSARTQEPDQGTQPAPVQAVRGAARHRRPPHPVRSPCCQPVPPGGATPRAARAPSWGPSASMRRSRRGAWLCSRERRHSTAVREAAELRRAIQHRTSRGTGGWGPRTTGRTSASRGS